MDLRPQQSLTVPDIRNGLKRVIGDGLCTEAMTTLTSGVFLVAMAVLLGASNLQIGMLAALPTFTNIFQLISIWLVLRYNNRKAVSVISSLLARVPLVIIGALLLLFPKSPVDVLIIGLFCYYFFASIAGPSWNAWMKDLVPEKLLGAYFSRRSSYMQALNVVLSISLAFGIDYIKKHYPGFETVTYAGMFIAAGFIGILGALILSRTPEPQSFLARENILRLFKRPLRDGNFRRLLLFNSAWVFAVNIATPFYAVFMMKSMGLPLVYIIILTMTSQLCSILTVRLWGRFGDRYSNKTIIAITGPLYIICMIAWCFAGIYSQMYANLILLAAIHIINGISTAGINLSLTNIGLKLAPREDAIVYLSVKNMITAFFSSMAPLVGGYLADYFMHRHLIINAEWGGPRLTKVFHLLSLHEWNFLFLIGAGVAFIAVELLSSVKEVGEVEKDVVVKILRSNIMSNLKEAFIIGRLIDWHGQLWRVIKKKTFGEKKANALNQ